MRTTMKVLAAVVLFAAACGGYDTSQRFDALVAACGDNPCPGATHEIVTAPITGTQIQAASPATLVCFCAAGSLSGLIPPSVSNCDGVRQAWAAGQCH